MKTKILDYNKEKAKVIFALLKFSEIFAIFLFFFGFNWLGKIGYDLIIRHMIEDAPTTYMEFWMCGLLTMLILLITIVLFVGILTGIFFLVKAWLMSNWRWAKIIVEDPSSKVKRLKEKEKIRKNKEIDRLQSARINLGACVGDKVKIKNNLVVGSDCGGYSFEPEMRFIGTRKVVETNSDYFEIEGMGDYSYTKSMIGKVDKCNIPNYSKINNQYIENDASLGDRE